MTDKEKICVLGDGAWGTALATVFDRNGFDVAVWGCFEDEIREIKQAHENVRFLPGVPLPDRIVFTDNMEEAVEKASLIVLGTPSQYMRGVLEKFKPLFKPEEHAVVNISKGIEVESLKRMSELCAEVLGEVHYCALSGPSHAEEVARKIPT